jgi:hypothetical protein
MREMIHACVERVGELAEHVRGNEQATRQSLVGPLFAFLGHDMTDPREYMPGHRVDFGPNFWARPIDLALLQSGHPIFFVGANAVENLLTNYNEEPADCFGKAPEARLVTSPTARHRHSAPTVANPNVMDTEPLVKQEVLTPSNSRATSYRCCGSPSSILPEPDRRRTQTGQNPLVAELNRPHQGSLHRIPRGSTLVKDMTRRRRLCNQGISRAD